MAKKVAKKSAKKVAKKTAKKVAKKKPVQKEKKGVKATAAKSTAAKKKTTKKVAKKTASKSAAKPDKKAKTSKAKPAAKAAVKVDSSKKNSGSKKVAASSKVKAKVVEEKKKNVTSKAKKTTKKSAGKSAKAAPAPEIKRGLKLAPGVMLTGAKPAAPKECDGAKTAHRKITKKEVAAIKERLLSMREDILEGVRKELAESKSRASSAPADIIDQAADAYDNDVSFEIAAASDEELEQIEAALERIAEGHYGECEMCSAVISPSRLKILPFATRCVSCRGNYEKTKRRRDSGMRNFFGEGDGAEGMSTDE